MKVEDVYKSTGQFDRREYTEAHQGIEHLCPKNEAYRQKDSIYVVGDQLLVANINDESDPWTLVCIKQGVTCSLAFAIVGCWSNNFSDGNIYEDGEAVWVLKKGELLQVGDTVVEKGLNNE